MKISKLMSALVLIAVSGVALANGNGQSGTTSTANANAQQQQTAVSGAVSTSNGGTQGQQQGIANSGNSQAGVANSGNSQAGVSGSGNSTATGGSAAVTGNTLQGGAGGAATVSGNTLQGGSAAASGNTSGNVTVGCLVNCASTDQGARDAADAQIQASLINAAAARDIAEINARAARDVAATKQRIYNTPSVSGPPLVSSNDTCMGSSSGSVNAPGIGVSIGTTWTDTNCKMLKNSRELWNMGMKAAAMALMCNDKDNREALELTGFECPQTAAKKKDQKVATAPAASSVAMADGGQYTDPIVRARLGLPALEVASK